MVTAAHVVIMANPLWISVMAQMLWAFFPIFRKVLLWFFTPPIAAPVPRYKQQTTIIIQLSQYSYIGQLQALEHNFF